MQYLCTDMNFICTRKTYEKKFNEYEQATVSQQNMGISK